MDYPEIASWLSTKYFGSFGSFSIGDSQTRRASVAGFPEARPRKTEKSYIELTITISMIVGCHLEDIQLSINAIIGSLYCSRQNLTTAMAVYAICAEVQQSTA